MAATDFLQALWATPGQANRLLRLATPLGGDTLIAERLDGVESIDGGGFRLRLAALSPNAELPLDKLLGAPVLVELLTADSRTDLRPFHGHVTAVEREGSNGGLARYHLTLEPWLAFLRYRQDSYAFHNATVIEIVEQVFGYYKKGVVVPAWRWELADRSIYKKRSPTSQYQESDYAFVTRLLAEEGIFYWFEHKGDRASATLGSHTLVLADANQAFHAGDATAIRYHRSNTTEQADTIQRWEPERRWQTGQIKRASWDYRTLGMRPAGASAAGAAASATDDDISGPYAWRDAAQGEYRAQQHADARHVDSNLVEGAGGVRRLAPGRSFTLVEHPTQDGSPLVTLRVEHHARNNLDADVQGAVDALLGPAIAGAGTAVAANQARAINTSAALGFDSDDTDADSSTHTFAPLARDRLNDPFPRLQVRPSSPVVEAAAETQTDFYHNTFTALPVARTYRPRTRNGDGLRRHPAPTASGAQSAIVTGSGDPLHTDRDHRVIVQQHWQRGGNAASRLDHPRRADAPADASSGTWARVMTPMAGGNWGSVMLPRVGQEVWLTYLEGDIDRPVVVAGIYNGAGNQDAPYNQQAGGPSNATGDAAAWFTGNDHPGVLSGIKTQDMATSQSGTGGYRQLQFDDTPNQGHAQLATTDYETALTLGHLKHLDSNARESDLGYGANLATLAQGALRGGAGLLITSAAGADQMDTTPATGVLDQNTQLLQGLTEVAAQQGAKLPEEPEAKKLNAVVEQTGLTKELGATHDGHAAGMGIGGGEGTATGWSKPHLVVHGQDGLNAVTPQSAVWVSGTDSVLTAGQDLNWIAQGQWSAIAAKGIALYVQGSKPAGSRPVNQIGIHLAAASGMASIQAQQDKADFAAEQAVTLSSSEGSINVGAKSHVLLTAAGAYLKLEGGNIEIGAPGNAFFRGAKRELTGGASGNAPQVTLAKATPKACPKKTSTAAASGAAAV